MSKVTLAAMLALAVGLPAPPGSAQEMPEFMTAVPENPAFTFLGASPSRINRPNSMRDLGVALLNGVSANGVVQQGVAVEASGWYLFQPDSLAPYQDSWLRRALTRTRLSFGTAKAATDSASTDLGVGLAITLFDGGDVMADAERTDELSDSLATCRPSSPGESALPCLRRKAQDVWSRYSTWNATRVELGVGSGLTFVESTWNDAELSGFGAWLVAAFKLGDHGQLITQASYRHTPEVDAAAAMDQVTYGGRFLFGTAHMNGFGELVGEYMDVADGTSDSSGEWSVGVEARVAKDLWISSGFGRRFSTLTEDAEKVVLIANVRWAISDAARFSALGIG